MYNATTISAKKQTAFRADIYKEKPAEQQEFEADCEHRIVSMSGVTRQQLEKAIEAVFPEWKLFCCWEIQEDEF
ncbi:MAG: hypothetical protein ACM37W_16230 [Actinomycetota bacterium]